MEKLCHQVGTICLSQSFTWGGRNNGDQASWGAGGVNLRGSKKGNTVTAFIFHFSLAVGEYQWSVTGLKPRVLIWNHPAWALLLLSWRTSRRFCCLLVGDSVPYPTFAGCLKKSHSAGSLEGLPAFNVGSISQTVPSRQVGPRFGGASVLVYLLESVTHPFG